jgi:hypothetical protein
MTNPNIQGAEQTARDQVNATEKTSVTDGLEEASSDLEDKIKLVETSFKTVLDADIHQDNKASRVLSAMAFVTAAAAAIFNRVYPATPPPAFLPSIIIPNVDIRPLTFIAFIVCIVVGAAFYIAALGPSLNIPSWFKQKEKPSNDIENIITPRSVLFFKFISELKQEEWDKYWKESDLQSIQQMIFSNYIKETWLIAQKAQAKFNWMSIGRIFFRLSFAFLLILVASVLTDQKIFASFTTFGLVCLFAVFAYEAWRRPPRDGFPFMWVWIVLAIVCLLAMVAMWFIV